MYKNYSVIFTKRATAELIPSEYCEKPGPDEIIGQTQVSVISNGSETGGFMAYGSGDEVEEGFYPCETGYANIIRVLEVGSEVKDIKPGDYAFTLTPHKLINRVKAKDTFLVPADFPLEKAALCRFPAVSMTAFLNSTIKPTEPALVTGLGIIGLTCAQFLQHCGYKVYAVDTKPERQEIARNCGLKYVGSSFEELNVPKKSAGLGMECSGNNQATFSMIPYLRQHGELALVGVPWNRTSDMYAHDLLREIFYAYLHVYSGWEWSLPLHSGDFDPNSNLRSMQTALDWICEGSIVTDGIYKLYSPKDCGTLYPAIVSGKIEKPVAIFDWREFPQQEPQN